MEISDSLDAFLAARAQQPVLLALGEPAHGVEVFPILRNELLRHLVERHGFRSIALETDMFAAAAINDYVLGGAGELDVLLETAFSHRFGALPSNRALVQWLRSHNAGRPPEEQVRFHGCDAPLEQAGASPRDTLLEALAQVPQSRRPVRPEALAGLLGEDAEWTDEAAMFDPAASIGNDERVRTLRLIADDIACALRRSAPDLRPDDYGAALTRIRTAQGILRYHATMASPAPDRVATLAGIRDQMMGDNLLTIARREQSRGPCLVFAHNVHLQRGPSRFGEDAAWWGGGALAARELGDRYAFIACDAAIDPEPGTLQAELAATTPGRALFPTAAIEAALPPGTGTARPMVRGHLPLSPAQLAGADAVVFLADTGGKQIAYW